MIKRTTARTAITATLSMRPDLLVFAKQLEHQAARREHARALAFADLRVAHVAPFPDGAAQLDAAVVARRDGGARDGQLADRALTHLAVDAADALVHALAE